MLNQLLFFKTLFFFWGGVPKKKEHFFIGGLLWCFLLGVQTNQMFFVAHRFFRRQDERICWDPSLVVATWSTAAAVCAKKPTTPALAKGWGGGTGRRREGGVKGGRGREGGGGRGGKGGGRRVFDLFRLDCYWVGSLDFHFLVEVKRFPTKTKQS